MSAKTIFIIAVSILVTVILMKNTDEVDFWLFGQARIPKLAIMGIMFATGLILGFLLGRPRKKQLNTSPTDTNFNSPVQDNGDGLSDEDREYIKQ